MADAIGASDRNSADGRDDMERAWIDVMQRCADLMPFFADSRLDVSATQVARQLGVRRAQGLERLLRMRGLPPFRLLRNWIYIVQLAQRHERGESVARWAMRRGEYPTPYYRMAIHETGQLWSVVAARGSAWCMAEAMLRWTPYL